MKTNEITKLIAAGLMAVLFSLSAFADENVIVFPADQVNVEVTGPAASAGGAVSASGTVSAEPASKAEPTSGVIAGKPVIADVPAEYVVGYNTDLNTGEKYEIMLNADGTEIGTFFSVREDGTEVYTHDGVSYIKGELWGDHPLTGYYADEQYGFLTYSGLAARPKHTCAAASSLPIGTVLIIEGCRGPYASEFNGVYVVEDRGGKAVEYGTEGTDYVSVVDLFFLTRPEAAYVTDYVQPHNFNIAHCYFAIPISQ